MKIKKSVIKRVLVEPTPRQTALTELQQLQKFHDVEFAHSRADDILCELLAASGFEDVVKEYQKVRKWYA